MKKKKTIPFGDKYIVKDKIQTFSLKETTYYKSPEEEKKGKPAFEIKIELMNGLWITETFTASEGEVLGDVFKSVEARLEVLLDWFDME